MSFKQMLGLIIAITILYQATPDTNHTDPKEPSYLLYAPHSGFNNQRIELENAILTAKILNKTLVIPPLFLGKAIPYFHFYKLRNKTQARLHKIAKTRNKCHEAIKDHLDLTDPTIIRNKLPLECRQPEFEVLKWSQLIDLSFLDQFPLSYVELDPFDFLKAPEILQIDPILIKDTEMYHYRLFDVPFEQVHAAHYPYFPLFNGTQPIPHHDATPLPMLKSYLGKYQLPLTLDHLKLLPSLQFGSLFSSTRLHLTKSIHKEWQQYIATHIHIDSQYLHALKSGIQSQMGPFLSIHYRATEAQFYKNRHRTLKKLMNALSDYTSKWSEWHSYHLKGFLYSEPVPLHMLQEGYSTHTYEWPWHPIVPTTNTPVPLPSTIPERLQACQQNQYTGLLKQNHTTSPLVLYMATDIPNPRQDALLAPFLVKYPCTFFLSDFQVAQEDPLMLNAIKRQLGQPMVPHEAQGLLGYGKGYLLQPFVDMMMTGEAVFGTKFSTFSQYMQRQYVKNCTGYNKWDMTGTPKEIWYKTFNRVANQMDMSRDYVKFIPKMYQLSVMWQVLGCGYSEMV